MSVTRQELRLLTGVIVITLIIGTVGYGIGSWNNDRVAQRVIASANGRTTEAIDLCEMQADEIDALRSEVESLTAAHSEEASVTAALHDELAEKLLVIDDLEGQVQVWKAKAATPAPSRSSVREPEPSAAPSNADAVACIKAAFPAHAHGEAIYIATKESGLDPRNVNSSSGCAGLFQLAACHGSLEQRLDPATNAKIAARLWAASGNSFVKHWYSHTSYARY